MHGCPVGSCCNANRGHGILAYLSSHGSSYVSITSGKLGRNFALVNTITVVRIGPMGCVVKTIFTKSVVVADPLREQPKVGECCSVRLLFQGKPRWSFWREEELIENFKSTNRENIVFLLKWIALAYVIDALILQHIIAEWIAGALGCQDVGAILLGAFVGTSASFELLCCGSFGS